jgi:hypothetical protein
MKPTLRTLWALIALPFVATPLIGGPAGGIVPHAIFHPIYIVLLSAAIFVLLRLWSFDHSRAVRGLTVALLVAQLTAIVGMVGEEFAVLAHGGLSTGKEMLEEPMHLAFATTLTVPALLASMLLLITLTLVTLMARRAERRPAAASS